MQINLNPDVLRKVAFLTGNAGFAALLPGVPAKKPFADDIVEFLNDVSKLLMKDRTAKTFPDVVTFAFWIRRASVLKLKERFEPGDNLFRLGKGVVFHVAPSNVPVNFAYSLAAGLLNGNANVVRVPSKDFEQVRILVKAFGQALREHEEMMPYVLLVRYERDKDVNDLFSSVADVRVTWGGDDTIAELRKSPLPPRSGEITFADRYSLAVIDSDSYLAIENKSRVAEDFYNDTFLTDQNACTSPRIVVWTGTRIEEAKRLFWAAEHDLVRRNYAFQAIQGVNKLTECCLAAVAAPGCRIEEHEDNLIVRVSVQKVTDSLMDFRCNSGFFFEYDCKDILELKELCNNKRCQTIACIGSREALLPLLNAGVRGIDRIVPMGKTMDFDLIWDGCHLPSLLTRVIPVS